jgi:DNA-binding transcriptional LysR family regulator
VVAFSRFIHYFVEVARAGSLRRASERLNVSASAIDRQILKAEEAFGLPLFERMPTGLRPTAAGELVLAASHRWTADYDRLQAQLADLVGLRRGHVRIGVIEALAKGFLASEARRLRDEFPGFTIELQVMDNVQAPAAILAGDVDFALMLNPQNSRDILVRGRRDVILGFVTPLDHVLAGHGARRFNACVEFDMVCPQEPLEIADQVRSLEAATGVQLRAVASSNNIQVLKSLVSEGVGIGVLSSIDVISEVDAGVLAFTPISDASSPKNVLALCVGRARQLSAAASLFLARIEQSFATPASR